MHTRKSTMLAKSGRPSRWTLQLSPHCLDRRTWRWSQHRYTRSATRMRTSTGTSTTAGTQSVWLVQFSQTVVFTAPTRTVRFVPFTSTVWLAPPTSTVVLYPPTWAYPEIE